jgi:hexulose-6-phosphate isomerase
MKAGISALILPREWGLDHTLEAVAENGYEAVELVIRESGYLSLDSSASELAAVAARVERAGLELVSVCPGLGERRADLMNGDETVRARGIESVQACLRVVADLGVDTMLLVLGRLTPDLYYEDAYQNALEALRLVAPRAEQTGVRIAIEYVWNKFLLSPMEFDRFCRDVGSPYVGFYFDPGNMAAFSYPEHWVHSCAEHLMAVHVKDFRRAGFEWTPLLEGDVDFPAVMRELRAAAFDGALVSEVDPSLEGLAETAQKIREIAAMGVASTG